MAVVPRGPIGVAKCVYCGREQEVQVTPHIRTGMVLRPFSGGYSYGRCRFCTRGGLEVISSPFDEDEEIKEEWEFLKVSL
jgi:hypothetical protein